MSKKEALEKWKQADRKDRDKVYAEVIFPLFKEEFAQKPLEGWHYSEKPQIEALISVLGFSWQPVALMAVWAKPQYILIIGTEDSVSRKVNGKSVVDLISELAGVSRDRIEICRSCEDELEIYRRVRNFVSSKGVDPHKIAIDLTGGKKYMSAVTALAGFLTGCLLMYVDYGEYDPSIRAPLPFSEYPKLIHNPLDIFGDVEKQKIIDAFNSGKFDLAYQLARTLEERLYDAKEIGILRDFCMAYNRWHRFNFGEALRLLEKAKQRADRFARAGRWTWYTREVSQQISMNVNVLRDLESAKNNVCKSDTCEFKDVYLLVANHLVSAKRYASYGEHTIAVMLLYSTVEKLCDAVLLLDYGIEDEKPDYSKVVSFIDWEVFHNKGRALIGPSYEERELRGPITYSVGVQLVATLKPDIVKDQDLPLLNGLAQLRNKCEFEHGLCPNIIDEKQFKNHYKVVRKIVERFALHYKADLKLDTLLQRLQFPRLKNLLYE